MTKIETLSRFKQFLEYIGKMEEYSVIHQYLSDQLDVIETNLEDMQTGKEDAEMEAQEGNIHDEVKQDPREVDPTTDDIEQAKEEDAERCPITGKLRKSDEETTLDNTSLEDLSVLSPEEYDMVQNFANFDADDWGYNKLQKFYFRKREGGEDEEKAKKDHDGDGKLESSTAEYMGSKDKAIKAAMSKEEENEEVALSPQEVARQMLIQRQNEMQNYYTQERLNRYGY